MRRKSPTGMVRRLSGPSSAPTLSKPPTQSLRASMTRETPSSAGHGAIQDRTSGTHEVRSAMTVLLAGTISTGSPVLGTTQ
jgi:hypothetical protein